MTEPIDASHDSPPEGWREERERLRRDREEASWLLLEAEQQIASLLAAPPRELDGEDIELVTLRIVVTNLQREVDALRASTSWRITAPMRRVSSLLHRRGA